MRVHTLLKQASANAGQHATEDQASDHSHQTHPGREEFELDVTEQPPTEDQLKNIFEYLGPNSFGSVIKGAKNQTEAFKAFKENKDALIAPVVCYAPLICVLGLSEEESGTNSDADGRLGKWTGCRWS